MTDRDQTIQETFSRVLSLVDEAKKTSGESSTQLLLWKAGAEAEYLAFQISMVNGLMDFEPAAEKSVDDPAHALDAARSRLQEGQTLLKTDPRKAYEAVRGAVSLLRKIHAGREKTIR